MKKRNIFILFMTYIFVFLGIGCSKKEESKLVSEIEQYSGYTRVISQEEYDFYTYFVKRDATKASSEEVLKEDIENYANEINAIFYIGNQLDLCEPYSYEVLKMRMEQENDVRKIKKEKGEIIYGLEKFNLESYFLYIKDNLELDIIDYIVANADEKMLDQAEAYLEEQREQFVTRDSVTYELVVDGETSEVTVKRDELNFMGKSDMALADFLELAEEGEIYKDNYNGSERSVVLKEIVYSDIDFSSNKLNVLTSYVREKLYPSLIETVATNNQVEFELEK